MLEFNAENFEELEEEIKLKGTEISLAIVKAVCDGLDVGADTISLGILSNLNMDISLHRENYLEALTLNLHRVEDAEEYELCSRAVKWIDQLQTEQEKE